MVTVGMMRSWFDSGYILKARSIEFAVEWERKRGVKGDSLKDRMAID